MASEEQLGVAVIEIRARFDQLTKDLDKAKQLTAKLPDATLKVDAAVDAAQAELRAVASQVDNLDDGSVKVDAQTEQALGEVRGLDKALDGIEDEQVRVDVDTGGAESAIGRLKGLVGGLAAGAGAGALLELGTQMDILAAKANIVFGDEAIGQVQAWASENAAGMGITDQAAVGLAAGLGDLLVPMGFSRTQAAEMSTGVLDLAGALSVWSGGTRSSAEVAGMLTDALLGETDALKGLGINLSAADVEARLAAKGQSELEGQALKQAEALAVQELLLENTTDAQRFFAEGGSDAMKSQQDLRAAWGEATQELSTNLLPAMSSAVGIAADVAGAFAAAPAPIQGLVLALGGLVLLSGPISTFAGLFMEGGPLLSAGKTALNFVKGTMVPGIYSAFSFLMAHPMVLVITAAILALIGIGYLLVKNWDTITAAVGAAWDWLGEKVGQVGDWIEGKVAAFTGAVAEKWAWVRDKAGEGALGSIFDTVIDGFKRAWNAVAGVVNRADFTLPASIPVIGGRTIGLPDLPMLAEGGTIARSGYAIVGERGPEVRWLNRGDSISPISDGGRAGVQVVFQQGAITGSVWATRDLATAIADVLEDRDYGRGRR